ncbi:MAG TPA: cytochrome P450 [Thermoleophilaceae bacterium]|nr:cytochrome P450 [Thermoleophilaceae bacterium]
MSSLPEASVEESFRVVFLGVLPAVSRGLFSPRPKVTRLQTSIDADRRTVAALGEIRRKHPGQGVKLLGGRIVVLWGPDAIAEVLEQSADVYDSGSGAKGKGMRHFQPDALTLSQGEEWRDRRRFTESVLATSERVHPLADRFLAVASEEVEALRLGSTLEWKDFERLFDRLTLRVIFGDRARGDQELTELLEKLMSEANRLVGLSQGDDFYEFYGMLESQLRDPEPGSLISRFADAPQSDSTRVVHQLPHWMFAMRDTLATNVYRALAAIAAQPEVERRVLEDLEGTDIGDPSQLDGLTYLEGCLQETMRLWPTTPLLARQTTREATLAGDQIDEGAQVMMLNVFNHRDPQTAPDIDRMKPEREPDVRFNHLSGGSQNCPGGPLVSLLGKAVLAQFFSRYRMHLREPALPSEGDMPHMLDAFALRFGVAPREL